MFIEPSSVILYVPRGSTSLDAPIFLQWSKALFKAPNMLGEFSVAPKSAALTTISFSGFGRSTSNSFAPVGSSPKFVYGSPAWSAGRNLSPKPSSMEKSFMAIFIPFTLLIEKTVSPFKEFPVSLIFICLYPLGDIGSLYTLVSHNIFPSFSCLTINCGYLPSASGQNVLYLNFTR